MAEMPTTKEFRDDTALASEYMAEILDALDSARRLLAECRSALNAAIYVDMDAVSRHDVCVPTVDKITAYLDGVKKGNDDETD